MLTATWTSVKSSPMMAEIRESLKLKTVPGEPTPSRKMANKTWREDILGILSEDQKQAQKAKKQEKNKKRRTQVLDTDE